MKRKIIRINEEKCNGCGQCIPACQEGALQIIDGKARLVSDLFCDGLGACIGYCPEDAITLEEREAEPYDEVKVMESISAKGRNTILAHLDHLRNHNEEGFLREAIKFLKENNIDMSPGPDRPEKERTVFPGCPGLKTMDLREGAVTPDASPDGHEPNKDIPSELRQWPIQLHLLNPQASYFREADVLLAADCVAFSMGNFHSRYLKGKSLAIACPKLDSHKESYVEKLTSMIRDAGIRSLTVLMMEVPCCGGLLQMARIAMENAGRNIPLKAAIIGIKGEVMEEEMI
ncbi:MAG TPA: 4Fe-4S binding protein [Bacteroidales bacterium]|nr:4Fe-4S binding protein [Bacteroidales bacterium]